MSGGCLAGWADTSVLAFGQVDPPRTILVVNAPFHRWDIRPSVCSAGKRGGSVNSARRSAC